MKYTVLLQASQIKTITVRLTQLCYFLTYLLDWYLLNISGTCTPVSLVTLAGCIAIVFLLCVLLWFPCGNSIMI